jgi:hypothetical protein
MPDGFSVGAAIRAVKNAYDTSKKVFEASKTLANAELKMLIAELAQQLADANLQMAELKNAMMQLQEQNAALKTKKESGKPKVVYNCYRFDDEPDKLFCLACFDTQGKRHLTARIDTESRHCTVCNRKISSS